MRISSSHNRDTRIYLTLLAVLMVLVGSAAQFIYSDYRSTIDRRYALVRDMAKVVESHVHRAVQGADTAMSLTERMVSDAGGLGQIRDLDHWRRLREYAAQVDGGRQIWLFDAKGDSVLESGSFPARSANVADRTYFQALRNGEDIFVGPAIRAKLSDHIFFTVSRPLRDHDGRFAGVIAVSMNTAYLTDFYSLMGFDMAPLIGVYRRDGGIVARRPALEQFVGANVVGEEAFRRAEHDADGIFRFRSSLDHRERLGAYRTIEEYGLLVQSGVELEQALSAWWERTLRFGGIALVAMLLVAAAIILGFRAVNRERKAFDALEVARCDGLTGLPSRGLWFELAEKAGAVSDLAVLLIDLDGFKAVNDRLGHQRGDEVLRQVGDILRTVLRDGDIPGRLGGDEFVVCIPGVGHGLENRAEGIAARLVEAIAAVGDGIGCSVGIVLSTKGQDEMADILRRADEAMYEAKRKGKGRFVLSGG